MVRSTKGGSGAALPVLTVFAVCCLLFSGALFALQTEETPATEPSVAESPVAGTPAEETVVAEKSAEPIVEEVKDPGQICDAAIHPGGDKVVSGGRDFVLRQSSAA